MATLKQIEAFLKIPSAVLIGSRGLKVNNKSSDYDIALLESDIPPEWLDNLVALDPTNYFKVLPSGNTCLYRSGSLDLLVYESQQHLDTIRFVMAELRMVPKYLLKSKTIRIHLYEEALVHYGFERVGSNNADEDPF
jgi:hypothetical protein